MKKYCAIWGITAIVSQYRAICGHKARSAQSECPSRIWGKAACRPTPSCQRLDRHFWMTLASISSQGLNRTVDKLALCSQRCLVLFSNFDENTRTARKAEPETPISWVAEEIVQGASRCHASKVDLKPRNFRQCLNKKLIDVPTCEFQQSEVDQITIHNTKPLCAILNPFLLVCNNQASNSKMQLDSGCSFFLTRLFCVGGALPEDLRQQQWNLPKVWRGIIPPEWSSNLWGLAKGSSISWVTKFKGDKHSERLSCQMGVVAKLKGDETPSFCREMSGREVRGR